MKGAIKNSKKAAPKGYITSIDDPTSCANALQISIHKSGISQLEIQNMGSIGKREQRVF